MVLFVPLLKSCSCSTLIHLRVQLLLLLGSDRFMFQCGCLCDDWLLHCVYCRLICVLFRVIVYVPHLLRLSLIDRVGVWIDTRECCWFHLRALLFVVVGAYSVSFNLNSLYLILRFCVLILFHVHYLQFRRFHIFFCARDPQTSEILYYFNEHHEQGRTTDIIVWRKEHCAALKLVHRNLCFCINDTQPNGSPTLQIYYVPKMLLLAKHSEVQF